MKWSIDDLVKLTAELNHAKLGFSLDLQQSYLYSPLRR